MPFRIALFACEFLPREGGWTTYTLNLAKALANQGNHVEVFAPRYSDLLETHEILHGFEVHRVFSPPTGAFYVDHLKILTQLIPLTKMIKSGNYTILHATTEYVMLPIVVLLGRLLDIPVVSSAHGTYSFSRNRIKRFMLRNSWKSSTSIIAVSKYTARALIRAYEIYSKKIHVISPGVDLEAFQPGLSNGILKDKFGIEQRPVFLSVARLVQRKGFDVSVRAFKIVKKAFPNARYIIVGIGNAEHHIRGLIKSLSLDDSVILAGYQEDLPLFYNACEVFVLTPIEVANHFEGFGLVYLEANACKKCVVASKIAGVPDAVEDGVSGILVSPYSVRETARAMIRLIEDDNLRKNLEITAYNRAVAKFSWNSIAKRIESIYFQATSNPPMG
ncbi:MAG: glycosyltransferase family 4 protein [Candidatus Heimdallarchaeota archaeon]